MKLRRPVVKDIDEVEKFAKEPLPRQFVEAAVIETDSGIIAFGAIRSNMEAILYPSGTLREKVESLKMLLEKAEEDTKKWNYHYLDVLAKDEDFAEILIKHFGFERVTGIPLIKKLG
jgi:hypothetical protein